MTIRANRKLTQLLRGRILDACEAASDGIVLRFADRSALHIKTGGGADEAGVAPFRNTAVSNVRQQDTSLVLEFASPEHSLSLRTLEPAASVLLRNANGLLEYAD